jgi:hypothetical protein
MVAMREHASGAPASTASILNVALGSGGSVDAPPRNRNLHV